MDWSQAAPALIVTTIGVVLLSASAALYLTGARTAVKTTTEDNPAGCVALVLLILGAFASWHGIDGLNQLIAR